MFLPGSEPDGFIEGRLLSDEARLKISKHQSIANTQRKGTLNKITIIKDGKLKCIGAKNLDKYIKLGYSIYQKGTGGII